MKTNILITTAIMLLGLIMQPTITKAEPASFKSAISQTVKYPATASKNGVEGTIWMSMQILEDGTMRIDASNHSCCQEFHDTVFNQLDGKKIKKFNTDMIGEHNIKFVFNIEK